MKKRLIALLMAVAMVFQITVMTPYSVSAAEITETNISAEEQKDEADVPVLRAEKAGTEVLAFTSDTHNKSGNEAANRLGSWIDTVVSKHGSIDAMAFGGDMAGASASGYWDLTQADMDKLTQRQVTGVYTTGNHEISAGGDFNYNTYTTTGYSSTTTKGQFKVSNEGIVGDNYRIYCLGSRSSSQSYQDSVSALTSYLNNAGNDKVIFIITHFPLHYYSGRSTTSASNVIDALNNAVTNNGQKIVFLWGHNHTMSDTYYDYIYRPGDQIPTGNSSSTNKTIQFYYGAAGCMSDSEYGGGSASVKGKGLVVTINSKKQLSFTYYDASGNNVTEGGTYTEQDPVAVTGVTISAPTQTVEVGRNLQLSVTISPADATDKSVKWTSSNESIATVDSTGKVRGVTAGKVTITATSNDKTNSPVPSDSIQITVEPRTSTGTTYVLADALENGKTYVIANGNSGSVYVLTTEANGSRTLKGAEATVSGDTLLLPDEYADTAEFICDLESSSNSKSTRLKNGTQYLYADSSSGLRMYTLTSSSDGKYWHYKADGRDILWFFKGDDGWTDTSQTYKYYLECSNGNFTDNHVSTTSLSNSNNLPKMYIFEKIEGPAVDPTGIILDKTSINLEAGDTAKLTATVAPSNATNKSVTWTSDNTAVATVSNGTVTAVAAGNATITATTVNGKTATCAVTVSPAPTVNYKLTSTIEAGKNYIIANGNSGSVYVLTTDANGSRTLKGIAATVSGEIITFKANEEAKAVFTATANSNSSAGGLWLVNNNQHLYADSNNGLRMEATSTTTNSSNRAKSWHYSNDAKLLWFFKDDGTNNGWTDTSQTYKYYLECSNGNFTDNHVSTTSLSSSNNLPKMYIYEKVTEQVAVTSVSLDKNTLTVSAGSSEQLTATVLPSNATNKAVTWTSSDNTVATVDADGVVTGVKAGEAVITVETADGKKTATCAVTVTPTKTVTYTLADTLVAGNEYVIANGKTGSVYLVSTESAGDRKLKGVAANVVDGKITITETAAKDVAFECYLETSGNANSTRLRNSGKDLYTNNANGLRMFAMTSEEANKHWHYKADGKDLLWFFKDTSSSDGYEDTSGTYKYYLECSNGVFTDAHVTSPSLANSNNLPKTYIFVKAAHEHNYGKPEWIWTFPDSNAKATRAVEGVSAVAKYTCDECGDVIEIEADVTKTETEEKTVYTASVTGPDGVTRSDTREEAKKIYKIIVTANKILTSNGEVTVSAGDKVTYTVKLSKVAHLGSIQMDLKIDPENAGLTYDANSFEIVSGVVGKLGFDTLDWTESTKRLNGMASAADYASEEETILATFTCTVGENFTGSAKPTFDNLEFYSVEDWTSHTAEYEVVYEEVESGDEISYVMSNNITFEGALTFNAYTVLSDEVLADEGAYMLVTYTTAPTPDTAEEVTEKIFVKNAATNTNSAGVVRRVFTVPFFIAQLNDEVKMRLYNSKGELMPFGRTVDGEIVDMTSTGVVDTPWAYCDRIINNPNSRPAMVELAKKTKIYGTAAQLHFNYHTDLIPAGAEATLNEAIAGDSIATALSAYTETTIGTKPAGISRYTKQIVFEADHALKYFFYLDGSVDISRYTFEVEDKDVAGKFNKVEPVKAGDGKYSIQRENIPSGYLSRDYRFRILEGGSVIYEITSSGLVYANAIVTKNSNPSMVTLVKAMYLYSQAAEANFGITH